MMEIVSLLKEVLKLEKKRRDLLIELRLIQMVKLQFLGVLCSSIINRKKEDLDDVARLEMLTNI